MASIQARARGDERFLSLRLALFRELSCEAFRGSVAPGRSDCLLQGCFADFLKVHTGSTLPSPRAFCRHENVGVVLRVVMLLLRRELDHPPTWRDSRAWQKSYRPRENPDGPCEPS